MSDSRKSDATEHREVERKLRVHATFALPDLVAAECGVATAEAVPTLQLSATYYDTADLRLARNRVTLRQRTGGIDDGWHLKLPDDASAAATRDEIGLPLDSGSADQPPTQLLDLVLALTRGAAVQPVATLLTSRTAHRLRDADGRDIAELTDDDVSVVEGELVTARFRELELELAPDVEPAALDPVVAVLLEAGAIEGGYVSKAARALGPAAAEPPDVPEPGTVRPEDPAGDAVRAHLAKHVGAFLRQDLRTRRRLPDSVHQTRVAARRLRSGLKVFAPLVDPAWSDALRDELAWAASELGGVRDREVLEDRLLTHLAELDDTESAGLAAAVVRKQLDAELVTARTDAATAMSTERWVALLDRLVDAARNPQLTEAAERPCTEALPPLVNKAWRRLVKDVVRLDADGADAEWHETRIAAKRARYAVEAMVPVFGDPAKAFAKQLEQVTEQLGEHQDAVIAADTARRMAGRRGVGGRTGFGLGLLYAAERDKVTAARAAFGRLWPEVSRRRHRRWLETGR